MHGSQCPLAEAARAVEVRPRPLHARLARLPAPTRLDAMEVQPWPFSSCRLALPMLARLDAKLARLPSLRTASELV